MRIGKNRQPSYFDNGNKQSELDKYKKVEEKQEIQESEAYNRVGPQTPRALRDLRKINKGIHGIITSIEDYRITIRVIHSDIFRINDSVRLDCTEYTRCIRLSDEITFDMLMVGERIKVKYLNTDIDKTSYLISNILSVEVY